MKKNIVFKYFYLLTQQKFNNILGLIIFYGTDMVIISVIFNSICRQIVVTHPLTSCMHLYILYFVHFSSICGHIVCKFWLSRI